ncbi:MAG: hypothetical protein HY725_20970 [Candidatus Rokubacteria bacterium]|nr:hypothetical protein [Candidatus Rokubacteria bacterium]
MRGLARGFAALGVLGHLLLGGAPGTATQVGALFPSDRFTVSDPAQLTGRRVALPLPHCAGDPAGCDEIRLLNQLDGFSVNPRLALSFSGPINLDSVTRERLFLLPLGENPASTRPIGLGQLVWDAEYTTLYAKPERILSQGRRYALVVSSRVLDADGHPLRAARKRSAGEPLEGILKILERQGISPGEVVAVSVFTTQSVTAQLEAIRTQLDRARPPALRFDLAPGGVPSVLSRAEVRGIEVRRHVAAGRPDPDARAVQLPLWLAAPSEVGTVAFGRFSSPSYLTPDRVIPAVPTRTGTLVPRGEEEVHVTLFLPAGPKPPGGWPVAIFGHGYGGSRHGSPLTVAGVLARHRIALAAINVVGHGGGPRGLLTVERSGQPAITLSAGGRGLDLNGDGRIEATEGLDVRSGSPLALVASRDGIRQTVVDLMQLVRLLRRDVDVDGDGHPDLDRERLYYFGQSLGGIYGTLLLAVDPQMPIGVLNVPGGPVVEIGRLAPVFRGLVARALRERIPPLMNGVKDFYEFMPLADESPVKNPPPGALAIQAYLDRAEWLQQSADPVAYAPHLRLAPLPGNAAKSVLYQFAVGDRTVPNPTTMSLLRAGDLLSFTSVYRHERIAGQLAEPFRDPHGFLTWTVDRSVASIGRAAQEQIARFFLSRGVRLENPDSFDPKPWSAPVFEVPIRTSLPAGLGF